MRHPNSSARASATSWKSGAKSCSRPESGSNRLTRRNPVQNKITPELILLMAAQLRRLEISEERAAQLATEVARVNDAARAAAADNGFNDEPSRYAVTLAKLKP